jgi:hypothetical protein
MFDLGELLGGLEGKHLRISAQMVFALPITARAPHRLLPPSDKLGPAPFFCACRRMSA